MSKVTKLGKSVREYKTYAILSPVLMIGEVVMEVLIPMITASIIDDGIEKGNMSHVALMGGLLVLASFVSLFFGVMAGRNASIAGAGFAKNLRKDLFYRIQDFSFANIDHFSTSSLVTRLTTDVTNVQNAFQMLIRMAFRAPIMLIFAVIMAVRINVELSMVFLIAIPILGFGLFMIMSHAHPVFRRVFKTYDRLNGVVRENVRGIRVVKNYVREDYEIRKFKSVSEDIFNDFSKAEKIVAWNGPLMNFCVYGCMLLVSWFGARLIVQSGNGALNPLGMTVGQLNSMFTYVNMILGSLMMLSFMIIMFTISRASIDRIIEVLDEENTMTDPENPVREMKNGSIRFDHVSFSYSGNRDRLALKDVCLDIPSGATVGILGGTGSSKSTLVQLIPRLYDVTEGTLTVGGVDVRQYDMEYLREQVSMVLQKNELFAGTVKDNLRWGSEHAADEELVAAAKAACADEFIQKMPEGYDTWIEHGGANVSGGQKQRLCIARALLKKPKILILDDSTSAVDTHTDAMIREAFRTEIPDTTKLIIAQRVASVEDADLVVLMDAGRVVACDSPANLMKNSVIYREIAESQKKGASENV